MQFSHRQHNVLPHAALQAYIVRHLVRRVIIHRAIDKGGVETIATPVLVVVGVIEETGVI